MKVRTTIENIGQTFDQVYLGSFERLCYHAFCIVDDEDDAKDIVNDVFTFVYERWDDFSAKPMKSFLLTLVHNASIDFYATNGLIGDMSSMFWHMKRTRNSFPTMRKKCSA